EVPMSPRRSRCEEIAIAVTISGSFPWLRLRRFRWYRESVLDEYPSSLFADEKIEESSGGVLFRAGANDDCRIDDRLVSIGLCRRNDPDLVAGLFCGGAVDDAGRNLAALDVAQHLSNVFTVDQSSLQLVGQSKLLQHLHGIFAGRHGLGFSDRDGLDRG